MYVLNTLKIFAALVFLTFAHIVVVTLAALACLSTAWASLTPTPTSSVLRVLFSDPIALISQASAGSNGLFGVTFLIGLGAAGLLLFWLVQTFPFLLAAPGTRFRSALLSLLIRGALIVLLVPLGGMTGVWASRLFAVHHTYRPFFFVTGGLVGFGAFVLALLALEIAVKPRSLGILRGRIKDDRHA